MHRALPAACAAFLFAVPASAEQDKQDAAESDRRCAVWAAISYDMYGDSESQVAFSMAMTWFLGRYEGATGKSFEEALSPDYFNSLEGQLDRLDEECQPRMLEMGNRFNDWSDHLGSAKE